MLAKLAAFLPSLTIGTISVTEFLSRMRLAASGHLDVGVAARFANELPSTLAGFMHAHAGLCGSAMAQVLHIAFAPAHAALSLVWALYQTSFATLVTVIHAAPIYLSRCM
jgi:hypothetical protein